MAYKIINTFQHPQGSLTQGLVIYKGKFIESIELYGTSALRKISIDTGLINMIHILPDDYIGADCTVLNNQVYQLTMKNNTGVIYDMATFNILSTFFYEGGGDGRGLTNNGTELIISNGSNVLSYIDLVNFKVVRTINVTHTDDKNKLELKLNTLVYVDGLIYSNIWRSFNIVCIDSKTGIVKHFIDLTTLYTPLVKEHILNGIAYDPDKKNLFVTGINWPYIYEIDLRLKKSICRII